MDDNQKVYSPDIKPYSFEGRSGIFGTLLSFIVAPIRITTRVMHTVFILPANMQETYAGSLFVVSGVMCGLGLFDLILYHKWPLLVSQIPCIYYATRLKKQAQRSAEIASAKREVDIDFEQVETLCNTVYNELENIVEE